MEIRKQIPEHPKSACKIYPNPEKPSQGRPRRAPGAQKAQPNNPTGLTERPVSARRAVRESTDFEVKRITQRIRNWREESGLTLIELARRSAVAASTIQKVETGQMIPTIAVLLKIARGLDRPATDLLRESTHEFQVAHLTAAERNRIGGKGPVVLERLGGDLSQPALEVWRVHLEPGNGSGTDRLRFDGESLILCEKGEITVSFDDKKYLVKAGDTLHYEANLPHSWHNQSAKPTEFVVIGSRPRVLRAALHEQLYPDPHLGA